MKAALVAISTLVVYDAVACHGAYRRAFGACVVAFFHAIGAWVYVT